MSNINSLVEEARANAAVGMEIVAFAKGAALLAKRRQKYLTIRLRTHYEN